MGKSAISQSTPAKRQEPGIPASEMIGLLEKINKFVTFAKDNGNDEPVILFQYGGNARYAEDMPGQHSEILDVQYSMVRNVIIITLGD